MNHTNDVIRIALGIHDPSGNYSRHAGVVMASIFSNTQSEVVVHILHDSTLTSQNRMRLEETADRLHQKVEFIDVTEDIARLGGKALHTAGRFLSVGCLFRLLLPDLLPYDKVIYMDCDVLVNLDIQELWNIELEDYCVAGARDPIAERGKKIFSRDFVISKLLGYNLSDYINSGVLLMNLKKIKSLFNLSKEALTYFSRYPHCAPPTDQNFINTLFHKKTLILEPRFNRNSTTRGDEYAILHVMGKPKPWDGFNEELASRLYWKFYALTGWKTEILDAVLDTAFNSTLNHRKTSQCYNRIFGRIRKDLGFCVKKTTAILSILFIEALYRLRAFLGGAK